MGITLFPGSDPSTQKQLGEKELPLEAPFIYSHDALPLDLSVLTICLTPVLFPCYASALMACPPPSQRPSQLGNQKNGNAEVRVPPILKDPHSSLMGVVGRLASAQGPPVGRRPGEVGLGPRGHLWPREGFFYTHTHTPITASRHCPCCILCLSVSLLIKIC